MTLAQLATLVAIVATGCEFNLHEYLHLWLGPRLTDWLNSLSAPGYADGEQVVFPIDFLIAPQTSVRVAFYAIVRARMAN